MDITYDKIKEIANIQIDILHDKLAHWGSKHMLADMIETHCELTGLKTLYIALLENLTNIDDTSKEPDYNRDKLIDRAYDEYKDGEWLTNLDKGVTK